VCRDPECLTSRSICTLDQGHDFGRNAAVQGNVFLEQRHNAPSKRLNLIDLVRRRLLLDGNDLRAQMVARRHVTSHPHTREPFDEDLRGATRRTRELGDSRHHPATIEIRRRGLIGVAAALRHEEDITILCHRTVDRG
jgi:hypothetical protein